MPIWTSVDKDNKYYASYNGNIYSKDMKTLYSASMISSRFTIPSNVTAIGKGAFQHNGIIKVLTTPSSVTTIGEGAFYDTEKLTEVIVPKSVKEIGSYAFSATNPTVHFEGTEADLKKIKIGSNNDALTSGKIKYHTYKVYIVAPKCDAYGYTNHICSDCGYSYKTDTTPSVDHSYKTTTVAPTCTAKGYTARTCSNCNKVEKSSYVDALGHNFVNGKCQRCGKSEDGNTEDEESPDRIFGASRYETAIKSAEELKDVMKVAKFKNIIVTNGDNFPDALAGGYLASVKDAPILLVNEDNESKIKSYIDSNLASGGTVYILGGTGSVSQRFANSLSGRVTRLGGASRYGTNIAILKAAGVTSKCDELLIASGKSYADALSVSATKKPVLLVDKHLTKNQIKFLNGLSINKLTVIGGEGSVSDDLVDEVISEIDADNPELTLELNRVAGSNRYATSVEIAKMYFGSKPSTVVLASALNFPDGLSGGPLAAKLGAPLILVSNESSAAAKAYCNKAGVKRSIALGGTKIISEPVRKSMVK